MNYRFSTPKNNNKGVTFSIPKQQKYRNVKKFYNGRWYDSTKEADYARDLDFRVLGRDIASWEPQIEYKFIHNDKLICAYNLDFKITHTDGTIEYIDVKSEATRKNPVYRIKNKMMKIFYNITITEV